MKYNLGDIIMVNSKHFSGDSYFVKGIVVAIPDTTVWGISILAVKESDNVNLSPLRFYNASSKYCEDENYDGFSLESVNDSEITVIKASGKEWRNFKREHKEWYRVEFRQCCICKTKYPIGLMSKINKKRYACSKCLHIQDYWTKNNEIAGSNTKIGAKYGFELECIPKSDTDYNMALANLLAKRKDIIPTSDASLPTSGVEFKTPIMCNLKYARGLLSEVSKNWDFSHDKCGQHINISIPELTKGMINSISQLEGYHKPFDILKEYMVAHEEETKTVCGRYFTYYAYCGNDYVSHENWINLSHDDRVEFRLSKVVSISQYITLVQMWTDILRICVKNYEDINSEIKPYHVANAIYGEKMIKTFQRYYKKISKMT